MFTRVILVLTVFGFSLPGAVAQSRDDTIKFIVGGSPVEFSPDKQGHLHLSSDKEPLWGERGDTTYKGEAHNVLMNGRCVDETIQISIKDECHFDTVTQLIGWDECVDPSKKKMISKIYVRANYDFTKVFSVGEDKNANKIVLRGRKNYICLGQYSPAFYEMLADPTAIQAKTCADEGAQSLLPAANADDLTRRMHAMEFFRQNICKSGAF